MRLAYTQVKARQKIPMTKGWNLIENAIWNKEELNGGNHGLLLAYCETPLCSLDIDDLRKANPMLKGIGIDPETLDAARMESGRTNSLKLLFKLPEGFEPLQTVQRKENDKVVFELRCANAKGRSVCEVIPPSIHPTGTTYTWTNRDLDNLTVIPDKLLYYWLGDLETQKDAKLPPVNTAVSHPKEEHEINDDLLKELLSRVPPDCGYDAWRKLLMAIAYTKAPSKEAIALEWSQHGYHEFDYKVFKDHWDYAISNPISQGHLINVAKDHGWRPPTSNSQVPTLKNSSSTVSENEILNPPESLKPDLLEMLRGWSSAGHSQEMRKQMLDDKFVIKDMAILGQMTALYAAPNCGKTLLTLAGLIEQIRVGESVGKNIYYVNADDTGKGAVEKLAIAESSGFEMLIPNYKGFKTKSLLPMMQGLIESKQATGIVFIMDTLKKFCDLMDKKSASDFGVLAREFVQAGGTLILLAHVNKHKKDGEPICGGTSDIVDDADCVYTFNKISEDNGIHTVEVKNKKARGDVTSMTCFQYTRIRGLPYQALLDSVKELPSDEVERVRLNAKALQSLTKNAELIKIIQDVIRKGSGGWSKGQVVKEVNTLSAFGMHKIREVIHLHEGDSYAEHYRWTGIKEGNANNYVLISPPSERRNN